MNPPPLSTPSRPVWDLTYSALEAELKASAIPSIHARELWRRLYRDPALPGGLAEAPVTPRLRRWLAGPNEQDPPVSSFPAKVTAAQVSNEGTTRKYLIQFLDGQEVEAVAMGYPGRVTTCVSTQAGCAMGCVFCATGQMGFARQLSAGEIVAQVLHVRDELRKLSQSGPRNLVLMGMGEPLNNYDSVMTALEIIRDTRGVNIGPSRITVSTVGVVPGILRMARERQPYHLAVSLHAANEERRSALIPASRRWPLAELLEACRVYSELSARRIFFQWTLIEGINDSMADAQELAAVLHGQSAHVNLIPLNATEGFEGAKSSLPATLAFQGVLREKGIPSTVRQRRGIDVSAGCGQLRSATAR